MITAPVAVLIARFGRYASYYTFLLSNPLLTKIVNRNKFKWLPSHRALQCGTGGTVLVGFGCAVAGNLMRDGKQFQDRHAVSTEYFALLWRGWESRSIVGLGGTRLLSGVGEGTTGLDPVKASLTVPEKLAPSRWPLFWHDKRGKTP
jgi:hypothetical protein